MFVFVALLKMDRSAANLSPNFHRLSKIRLSFVCRKIKFTVFADVDGCVAMVALVIIIDDEADTQASTAAANANDVEQNIKSTCIYLKVASNVHLATG